MKYIAICGTVGSGKTTLLERLIARLGDRAAWHEERPQDNPFITDYYADTALDLPCADLLPLALF